MRVKIHRGAKEVGGNCVEVESAGCRLVLDVGRPLDAPRDELVPLPDVPGLSGGDPSLLGLVISHGHQDHWGLVDQVHRSVPIYMGEATNRILTEAAFFGTGVAISPRGVLEDRRTFVLGPFTVTPYLNDHSAFDTYSVLIEADRRRLFYSADFQGHGRKAALFEQLMVNPPSGVHVVLMEGTHVRSGHGESVCKSEKDLEAELTATFNATPGMVLAMYSGQNIDRVVTMFRASVRSGRKFVMDLYGASIAAATANGNIPQRGFKDVRVYVPLRQRIQVKESGHFERVAGVKATRIFPEELAARAHELVLTFRASMQAEIETANCLNGAGAVWSMWPGYLEQPNQQRLLEFLERNSIPMSRLHASGHAYVPDLQRFARAFLPARIVPIHSFAPQRFAEYFQNVERHTDGEWWEV